MGLVVLLQSTSVLGHRRRSGAAARLALSEAERADREAAAAAHHYRVHDELQAWFARDAALAAVSVGWEGGVHAASCGHHLHLRCLHAYLRTLHAGARAAAGVERGEYLCPVCRQLANAALPLAPRAPRPAGPAPPLRDLLALHHPAPVSIHTPART